MQLDRDSTAPALPRPVTGLRDFWRNTYLLPRVALLVAAIAAAANLGSYAGLSMRVRYGGVLAAVHVGILLLGVVTFVRVALHHLLAIRTLGARVSAAPVPRSVALLTVAALLHVFGVLLWFFFTYGEGGAQYRDGQEVWVLNDRVTKVLPAGSIAVFATRELRLFSAAWLCLALALACALHVVESRIHAYRTSRRRPPA